MKIASYETNFTDAQWELLEPVLPHFTWLRKLWVDGGYTGEDFAAWLKTQRPTLAVEAIKRRDDVTT